MGLIRVVVGTSGLMPQSPTYKYKHKFMGLILGSTWG